MAVAAYNTEVLGDAPAGYWPLDETSGTVAADLSGNGRNGTYMNTGDFTLAGRTVGPFAAPNFGGVNAYVNMGDNDAFSVTGASGALTIEAWIIPDLASDEMIFTKGASSNYEYRFNSSPAGAGAGLGLSITNGSGAGGENTWTVTSTPMTLGTGYHVAVTWDRAASQTKFFINGVQVGTTLGGHTVTMPNGTAPLEIGRRADGALGTWDGAICRVAFYRRVLAPQRLAAHYAAALAPASRWSDTGSRSPMVMG